MADFAAHIAQAKANVEVLKSINSSVPNSWDWQLTVSFYVAVHVVNAHMAFEDNQHYKSHESVKHALFSGAKVSVPQHVYLAYCKLEQLSRRARYLCSEKQGADNTSVYLTYDLHFAKAIRHLDVILLFFCKKHKINIAKSILDCPELRGDNLSYFKHQPAAEKAA